MSMMKNKVGEISESAVIQGYFPRFETLAMIMVNLAKSWLTMVPLSSSWQIMIHGTLVKIKIMARSW